MQQPRCEDFPFTEDWYSESNQSSQQGIRLEQLRCSSPKGLWCCHKVWRHVWRWTIEPGLCKVNSLEAFGLHSQWSAYPPAAPDRLRKATEDIICLCDSGIDDDIRQNSKPAASSKKSSEKSSTLDEQNNQDKQNKDNKDAPSNRKQGGFFWRWRESSTYNQSSV